ncbi:hypothetical protein ES319_D08G171600v1 [Gossypium barbadense]|uniref:Uncharacterized protein n=1 Tax=Gossypium barbadense TaxID=3634 RepID=A0A5J5QEV8_GOSBA|nr:hypothetical protein ES319_D08G171600v1 [Gossypium barbadense]
MPKENKTEVMQKLTSLFFHVEQVFPQCRGLISCLGTSQIANHIESIKEFPIKFKLAKVKKYLTKKIKVKNQKTRCHVQPIQLNRN